MYGIVHLLVLGSLVLGSEILFNILYFIYFSIFYIFPIESIHDIQRAN